MGFYFLSKQQNVLLEVLPAFGPGWTLDFNDGMIVSPIRHPTESRTSVSAQTTGSSGGRANVQQQPKIR